MLRCLCEFVHVCIGCSAARIREVTPVAYIRLSLAAPPPDRLVEVRQYYEELVAYAAALPGFVMGWVVVPGFGDGEVGRLTVWETEAAANRAANDLHMMALHAQVQFAASGHLWDRSFDTDRLTTAASAGAGELDPAEVVRAVEALYQRHNM